MEIYKDLKRTEIYKTLNASCYTLSSASRLCGISPWRVSSWLRGYEYQYAIKDGEEIREGRQNGLIHRVGNEESTYVTFLELIDLLFVKRFLTFGFSLQQTRRFLNEAREYLDTPHFASKKFLVSGRSVYLGNCKLPDDAKGLITLLTGGQLAFPEIIKPLSEKIEFEDITEYELARRWYPLGKDEDIIVDPTVSFGSPTIRGSRITTLNVYDLYKGEKEEVDRLHQWFNISPTKINAAIKFEQIINA